jgi:hypothetical protein
MGKHLSVALALAFLYLMSAVNTSHAEIILETGPMGTTIGGKAIAGPPLEPITSFHGARFTLTDYHLITRIGGHIQGRSYLDRTLFVALTPTVGEGKFPSDVELSQAIFTKTFVAPFREGDLPVPNDTMVEAGVLLPPGDYAIVFGTSLFGAYGYGWMPEQYIGYDPDVFFLYASHISETFFSEDPETATYRLRFVVEGIPAAIPYLLDFFDDSVEDGTLFGVGPGRSAENRLEALRNMIIYAEELDEEGGDFCSQLEDIYQLTDGLPRPSDFVAGPAAPDLAQLVQGILLSECE